MSPTRILALAAHSQRASNLNLNATQVPVLAEFCKYRAWGRPGPGQGAPRLGGFVNFDRMQGSPRRRGARPCVTGNFKLKIAENENPGQAGPLHWAGATAPSPPSLPSASEGGGRWSPWSLLRLPLPGVSSHLPAQTSTRPAPPAHETGTMPCRHRVRSGSNSRLWWKKQQC
jgi:hypothetical protein